MEKTYRVQEKGTRRRFRLKGLRWYIIGLIGLATVINYIDRNALSIMWPGISRSLHFSKEDYAWMITCFMIAYAIGQTATGKIFDAIGTRLGFIGSMFIWSASIALHSIARGLSSFGLVRFTLGFGESGNWPGAAKTSAEWFPAKERAVAQGIFNAGASVGAVISAPLIALLYVEAGWRLTFLVIGLLGLLWLVPWLVFSWSKKKRHPWLSEEEKKYIEGDGATAAGSLQERVYSWKELLRFRETWAVILSRFFLDPVWWLFVNWLPVYLSERFLFDVKTIGAFAWVPYVGAAAGSLLGGLFSSRLIKRKGRPVRSRIAAVIVGCIVMLPSLVLTAFATTPFTAIGLITLILFGFQFAISNIQTLPSDFYDGRNVGTVTGMSGTAAVAGVLITTWLVPALTHHGYFWFFLLGAMLVPLAYLSVWLLSAAPKGKTDVHRAYKTTAI